MHSYKTHLVAAFLNLVLFIALYFPINNFSLNLDTNLCPTFDWEIDLPLIEWMIIPYLSINLFFVLPLFFMRSGEARKLGIAFGVCTIIGSLSFLLIPCENSFHRNIEQGSFQGIYNGLYLLDYQFNNIPSLHATYTTLISLTILPNIKSFELKLGVSMWAVSIVVSAMLTHQHNLIDILSGIALGVIAARFMKYGNILLSK